jgi:hypothetical protein
MAAISSIWMTQQTSAAGTPDLTIGVVPWRVVARLVPKMGAELRDPTALELAILHQEGWSDQVATTLDVPLADGTLDKLGPLILQTLAGMLAAAQAWVGREPVAFVKPPAEPEEDPAPEA